MLQRRMFIWLLCFEQVFEPSTFLVGFPGVKTEELRKGRMLAGLGTFGGYFRKSLPYKHPMKSAETLKKNKT